MTDTVRAIENSEERMEEFKQSQTRYLFQDKDTKGIMTKTLHTITCPACNEKVEAVAWDGIVKGYCTAARKQVKFII